MNPLQAIRLDESHDLRTGETRNFLVLGTGKGHEIRLPISDDNLQLVVNAIGGGPTDPDAEMREMNERAQRRADAELPVEVPSLPPEEPQLTEEEKDAAEHTPIAWNELDDGILSPIMKAAFFRLKAPMLMTPKAIMALVEDIASKFSAEDWQEVTGVPAVAPEALSGPPLATTPTRTHIPQEQPNVALAAPSVRWADGTPMMPGSVTGRTVPSDDFGYPIVEGEVDPGEVVGRGSEADEDGVGQV